MSRHIALKIFCYREVFKHFVIEMELQTVNDCLPFDCSDVKRCFISR